MATGKYGEDAPIEVRAELLHRWQPRAPRAAWEGAPAPAGAPGAHAAEGGEHDGVLCEAAAERAVAAAQAAGVEHYRVEAAPDGKVVIVVGGGPAGAAEPDAP